MPGGKNTRKALKICCGITLIFLIIFIIVSVTLFFTLFKPKEPEITAHPASLEHIEIQILPTFSLNATLGLIVTIDNRNYGGFEYKNTTAYVSYHDTEVAEVAIEHETVPARGKLNISTYANVTADKLISSPYFWNDLFAGRFNLKSTTTLHGEAIVLKIFKLGTTILSTCDISVIVQSQAVESVCKSKIKL